MTPGELLVLSPRELDAILLSRRVAELDKRIQALEQQNAALERQVNLESHNQPCHYCGKPTNDLAANPDKWGIPLCHPDEPGVVKWHHIGCVSTRLEAVAALEQKAENWELIAIGKSLVVGHSDHYT